MNRSTTRILSLGFLLATLALGACKDTTGPDCDICPPPPPRSSSGWVGDWEVTQIEYDCASGAETNRYTHVISICPEDVSEEYFRVRGCEMSTFTETRVQGQCVDSFEFGDCRTEMTWSVEWRRDGATMSGDGTLSFSYGDDCSIDSPGDCYRVEFSGRRIGDPSVCGLELRGFRDGRL